MVGKYVHENIIKNVAYLLANFASHSHEALVWVEEAQVFVFIVCHKMCFMWKRLNIPSYYANSGRA